LETGRYGLYSFAQTILFHIGECADDKGFNVHGDLSQRSPPGTILSRELPGEEVFINPPSELVDTIGQHVEKCWRTMIKYILTIYVLRKWAKFNKLAANWKIYHEFLTRIQCFTRQLSSNATPQETVALAPCTNPMCTWGWWIRNVRFHLLMM
jgi:hypothetical protein